MTLAGNRVYPCPRCQRPARRTFKCGCAACKYTVIEKYGITGRAVTILGGVAKLEAMQPEARALMLSIARKRRVK